MANPLSDFLRDYLTVGIFVGLSVVLFGLLLLLSWALRPNRPQAGKYVSYESGVDPENDTETLAEVTFEINTWRWAGVPFTLRSGKGLEARRREIVITFRAVPHLPTGLHGHEEPTVLRIFLAPDEMSLELNLNGPGDPYELERVSLDVTFGPGQLLAYGEVLDGLLDGDPSLSVRGDTAEQCWRIVAPVLAAWREGKVPLDEYPAGATGPTNWIPLG